MLCRFIRTHPLLSSRFEPFAFEEEPAQENTPQLVYLDGVENCDIYLGIYGTQYGYEDAEGISPTEREYDRATELGKYRLAYVRIAEENERHPKEEALIHKIEQDIVRHAFVDSEGLRNAVIASLVRYLEKKGFLLCSPFDSSITPGATMNDMDVPFMRNYIRMARAKRNFKLEEDTPADELLRKLYLMNDDGSLVNAAILLFGKDPQRYLPSRLHKHSKRSGNALPRQVGNP